MGMQERMALVDGAVKVESTPGSGTTVRAEVPARHRDGHVAAESPAPEEMAG